MSELSRSPRRIPRWILYPTAALGLIIAFFIVNRAAYESTWDAYQTHRSTGLSVATYVARSPEGMLLSAGPNITRASSLSVRTHEFDRAVSQIPEIVRQHDGYLEEWKIHSRSHAGRWLEASLRVAAARADSAVAELKALGDVEQESEANEDVGLEKETLTEKLQAERVNLAHLEQIVRPHKGSLHDVVEAEEQLVPLREKVRDLEKQRKKPLARSTYATVSLSLAEEYRTSLRWDSSRSFLYLRNSSIEGVGAILSSVTSCLGFLLHYGPSVLLWGSLGYAVLRLVRRFRHKTTALQSSVGS